MSIFTRLCMATYNGLWRVAIPGLKRHHRLKEGFDQRLVPNEWPYCDRNVNAVEPSTSHHFRLWIQAASGGEATLVEALAQALEENIRQDEATFSLELVCTSCTKQGMDVLHRAAQKISSNNIHITPAYFPLDSASFMQKALQQALPSAIVLLETELWPALLAQAKKIGIPVFILNARMTEKSSKAYALGKFFFSSNSPQTILATTASSAQRFSALFPDAAVSLMNNIKFDIAAKLLTPQYDKTHTIPDVLSVAGHTSANPIALFASVREQEESLLLESVKALVNAKVQTKTPLVVIAPRHLHRAKNWVAMLQQAGIATKEYTKQDVSIIPQDSSHKPNAQPITTKVRQKDTGQRAPSKADVLVWNAFGDLPGLYAQANAVFVGGSLAPLGGQNFLEPLAKGVIPHIGPSYFNFDWVGEDIFEAGLVKVCASPQELSATMLAALGTPTLPCTASTTENAETPMESRVFSSKESINMCPFANKLAVRNAFAAWLSTKQGGTTVAASTLLSFLRKC